MTDRDAFTPVIVGIMMVKTAYDMYPDDFQWRQNEYEYEFGKNAFDVISGTGQIRKLIESNASIDEIRTAATTGLDEFKELRAKYLLY